MNETFTKLNFRRMENWASRVDKRASSHLLSVNKVERGERKQTDDSIGISSSLAGEFHQPQHPRRGSRCEIQTQRLPERGGPLFDRKTNQVYGVFSLTIQTHRAHSQVRFPQRARSKRGFLRQTDRHSMLGGRAALCRSVTH